MSRRCAFVAQRQTIVFVTLCLGFVRSERLKGKNQTQTYAIQQDVYSRVCASSTARGPSFSKDGIGDVKNRRYTRSKFVTLTELSAANRIKNEPWNPKKPEDLHAKYDEIFQTRNRNAASHLWAAYVLDHAEELSHEQIDLMFSSFCGVSGSPLKPMPQSRYKVSLKDAEGIPIDGYTYHCCFPCICDTVDFLRVDTKSIIDKAGMKKQYRFMVMGNPCAKKSPPVCKQEEEALCIPSEAPEVVCDGTSLRGAHVSDRGHVILGYFQEENSSYTSADYADYEADAGDGRTLKATCEERAQMGFQSGMGQIFRHVAALSPISDISEGTRGEGRT